MSKDSCYSRRGFLGMLAFTSGATAARPLFAWIPPRSIASKRRHRFAYIASCEPGANGIHVFAAAQDPWCKVEFQETESPAALVLSSDQRTLFVANCIRTYQGRPAATVASYEVHGTSGRLTLISRQPLALSAVEPRFLAVSPDTKHLAVAATGGGSYNLLPIHPDGSLGGVSMLRKETGSGPHPEFQKTSRPGQLTFDRQGHLLTTDLGSDRVSSFLPADDSLQLIERSHSQPGSGPASIALHPTSGLLFVGNALNGTIRLQQYDSAMGSLRDDPHFHAGVRPGAELTGLALHSSGEFLLSTWNAKSHAGLISWRIAAARSSLLLADEITLPGSLLGLTPAMDGRSVIALNKTTGAAISFEFSPNGCFGRQQELASVATPSAITLF